jgi:1-acyl-sn-glycerol-3-phosphate acyltransferase
VPVGVAGAYEAYPRGQLVPRLSPLFWRPTGAAIATSVGKPIPPEHFARMSREEMLEELFHKVRDQVERAEKLVRKKT